MPKYGAYIKFVAQPGKRDALRDLLLDAAESVKGLEGCDLYIVNTSPAEADAVWVTEVWRSEAEAAAPLVVEGAQERIGRVLALLAAPPERIVVTPVGGKGFR